MPESSTEEIARRLDQYPRGALSYFGGGFAIAATLSEEERNVVLEELIASLKRGTRRVSGAALSVASRIGEAESEQLASIYSLMIGLLSHSSATPEDFIATAREKLVPIAHEAMALSIAKSICARRVEIDATVALAQLAGEVLPSFARVEIATDIRVQISKGQVEYAVPVAIVRIDTDSDQHDLSLQLSRGDLEDLIKKLSECLEKMKVAEAFALRGR